MAVQLTEYRSHIYVFQHGDDEVRLSELSTQLCRPLLV